MTGKLPTPRIHERTEALLARVFRKSGYVREPDRDLCKAFKTHYSKGYKVRLVLADRRELVDMRLWLRQRGFKPGTPFTKLRQFVHPIQGKASLQRFRVLVRKK
jgi:hypothetical protein